MVLYEACLAPTLTHDILCVTPVEAEAGRIQFEHTAAHFIQSNTNELDMCLLPAPA